MIKNNKEILVVIPARGGSKGIPRKNVRLLNGKPLIEYSIENAKKSKYNLDICISTDDDEIKRISYLNKVEVVYRGEHLSDDQTTLDPVIYDAFIKMSHKLNKTYDYVVTLQATSPLLTSRTLDKALSYILSKSHIDTLISAVNEPHLAWVKQNDEYVPSYEKRVNRQYLPEHLVETGAFLISKTEFVTEFSRIGNNVSVFEVPKDEAIDIDTDHDWWLAEGELNRKNILIRVEGYSEIGLGHVYRGLSLVYGLIDHNVHFAVSARSDLAINKLKQSHFPYTVINDEEDIVSIIREKNIEIIINDILNTNYEYIKKLKEENVRVVNFEDLGEGSEIADAVINDLYAPLKSGNNYYWGSSYYILRDEFITSHPIKVKNNVENILIIFGGVDPSNLSRKVFESIQLIKNKESINFTFIVGPGYPYFEKLSKLANESELYVRVIKDVKDMSYYMSEADLAVSSQGRTMLELASMGVPTILFAQNERELTHEFGNLTNGFINLGLGSELSNQSIATTLNWLIETPQIREQMNKQMSRHDLKNGLDRVLKIILD